MRPVGFFPHRGATILHPRVCSCAHLQSDHVVFMWSIFPSLAMGFRVLICLASSFEGYLLR